jgi:hypothetical protein
MDDLVATCQGLAELAEAARTAQRSGDVTALARIVQGRGAIIERCRALWPQATDEERQAAQTHLRQALETDAATLAEARAWLDIARMQLVHLQRGSVALRCYGSSLAILRDLAR